MTIPLYPGDMTPESKMALGERLGLTGGEVTGPQDDVRLDDVTAAKADAEAAAAAFGNEARDVILQSPAGSTATEGYHLEQQSAALTDGGGDLDVPGVPDAEDYPPDTERA